MLQTPQPPTLHWRSPKAIWANYSVHIWLQRQFGPNTVFTYIRLAGCHRPPRPPHQWRCSKAIFRPNTVPFNLVWCGNNRQRGVDFAPQLPQHCFWFSLLYTAPDHPPTPHNCQLLLTCQSNAMHVWSQDTQKKLMRVLARGLEADKRPGSPDPKKTRFLFGLAV